ncbi:efflux RND transporter periplasmic adaptor subunit [Reichenbachiella versicolor]|uniref:efflux RND transporter periplasmic adaptor subunit n=1 Tax=Reichenbachiella versicolor TaxID=1821036 RepID=UPI000D6E47EF|nr:HlyD family efflux transporter periplasmic adaptor subunit [Reichenbachiella versicolor]
MDNRNNLIIRQGSIILALLLIIGAFFGAKSIISNKKGKKPKAERPLYTAYIETVKNDDIPIQIEESGRLMAKRKVNLYSEVQGVMQSLEKEFKPGTTFNKGETILKIRNGDFYANLQAQKSVLQNLITSILPDLRLDFPESFPTWNQYLKDFDINKSIASLPEPKSEKEKFFITGKNIYTTYYNTKNLEITYGKYTLRAPFSGVLTESNVNPGTVIRPGQKLGEFIDPSIYELEISVSQSLVNSVKAGVEVEVYLADNPKTIWKGIISRINGKVDPTTQTVDVFIDLKGKDLKGKDLKEGMFLEARLPGIQKTNAYEVHRKLLVDDHQLYVVSDSILQLIPINVLHKNKTTAVVSGLKDGQQLVSRSISGAYEGMKVSIASNKEAK